MLTIALSSVLLSHYNSFSSPQFHDSPQGTVPDAVKAKVASVSMFKNGYAFITREFPITDDKAKIVEVPQTSLGSLWFWAEDGQIESVSSVNETQTIESQVPISNSEDLLRENLGKKFAITMKYDDKKDDKITERIEVVEGKLVHLKDNLLAIETTQGTQFLSKSMIHKISILDPNPKLTTKQITQAGVRYYNVKTKGGCKKVQMLSLEYGMAWAPGYGIELKENGKLTFVAKSTIINELLDFENTQLRLITGVPSLQFQRMPDPLSTPMSLNDWLASLLPGAGSQFLSGGAGGFANTQSRAGEMIRKPAVAPTPNFDIQSIEANVESEQLEDLLYFDVKNVSLKKNSRSYQYLYRFETPYKRVYVWDGVEKSPIRNTISFKNESGNPISTAAATIFRKGEVVGQSMMNYTAVNTEAEMEISRSLDFGTEVVTEFVDRVTGAIKDKKGNAIKDLVSYKITLSVQNPKSTATGFMIKRVVTGEVGDVKPEAKKTINKTGLKGSNPTTNLNWEFTLAPGEEREFEYRFKAYVPTGQ